LRLSDGVGYYTTAGLLNDGYTEMLHGREERREGWRRRSKDPPEREKEIRGRKRTKRTSTVHGSDKRTRSAGVGWLNGTVERERERERGEKRASTFNLGESARIEIRFAFIFHRACLRSGGPRN